MRNWIEPALFAHSIQLDVSARALGGEPQPFAAATADLAGFEPMSVGGAWGAAWDTWWFRFRGVVPAEWAGRRVVARLDLGFNDYDDGGGSGGFGAEGLAYDAATGDVLHGVSGRHKEVPVADPAAGGEMVDWFVEAGANPNVVAYLTIGLPAPWESVDVGGALQLRLARAELAVVDTEVRALWHQLRLARELAKVTQPGTPRASELLAAQLRAIDAIDPANVAGTAARAREHLDEALSRPTQIRHHVIAAGHAHIDTAWLWPLRETRRKVARTVASALSIMDEHPEYRFSMSAPQHWAWVEQDQPELFQRMLAAVRRGQLEPVGAAWVEPDCNVPSGESMIRQLVHGWRWFRDHVGVEVDGVFVPDVFGYPASLPSLLAGSGLTWFSTQKISWSRVNRFPHHSFWWRGVDGSRVFAHFPPADTYNAELSVEQLRRHVERFNDHRTAATSLALFGFGDGGGGPTRQLVERAALVRNVEDLPTLELGTVEAFHRAAVAEIEAVDAAGGEAPMWSGELYLEMHRGTYTTHRDAKGGNRRMEHLLVEAETWWSARCLEAGGWSSYPQAELDAAWKEVLTLQFHDILPGSSIGWVYRDLRDAYARLAPQIEALRDRALSWSGGTTTVVNPMARHRRGLVDGNWVAVPPLSVVPLDTAIASAATLGPDGVESGPPPVMVRGDGSAPWAANGRVRIAWDPATGELTGVRLLDGAVPREAVADGATVHLDLFDDRPTEYDAWDIDGHTLANPVPWLAADEVAATDDGYLVRRTSPSGRSTLTQRVRLRPGSPRIDLEIDVDWHEDQTLLKLAVPTSLAPPTVTCGIQHGTVQRPTHRNTSWDEAKFEVCVHGFADLGEHGFGVAVILDDIYGLDAIDGTIRVSLLRSPMAPDPDADRGEHHLRVSLLPHLGTWAEAGVVEAAEDLGRPLRLGPSAAAPVAPVAFVDGPFGAAGISIESIKKAEDTDALIVRVRETRGGRGFGVLRVPLAEAAEQSATRVDHLERPLAGAPSVGLPLMLELRPYEVATFLVA